MAILDLFYQIWMSELSNLANIEKYSATLLYEKYSAGLTPQQFFEENIYLPF